MHLLFMSVLSVFAKCSSLLMCRAEAEQGHEWQIVIIEFLFSLRLLFIAAVRNIVLMSRPPAL